MIKKHVSQEQVRYTLIRRRGFRIWQRIKYFLLQQLYSGPQCEICEQDFAEMKIRDPTPGKGRSYLLVCEICNKIYNTRR